MAVTWCRPWTVSRGSEAFMIFYGFGGERPIPEGIGGREKRTRCGPRRSPCRAERWYSGPRVNAFLVERLVGVDVAEARDHLLVQQSPLDGAAAVFKGHQKGPHAGAAGIGAKVLRLYEGFRRINQAHTSELARTLERQAGPVFEVELNVRVFRHLSIWHNLHAARHAKVEGEPTGVVAIADKDVLAMTVGLRERAPSEHLIEAMRLQSVAEDERVDDRGAANVVPKGVVGHTAFVDDGIGEFRHGSAGQEGLIDERAKPFSLFLALQIVSNHEARDAAVLLQTAAHAAHHEQRFEGIAALVEDERPVVRPGVERAL